MARRKRKSNLSILIVFVLFIIFIIYLLYNYDSENTNIIKNSNENKSQINKNNENINTKENSESNINSNSSKIETIEEPETEEEQNKIEETSKSLNLDVASIELIGNEYVTLSVNENYKDQGAKAYNKDGEDISDNIKIDSNLDVTTKGDYTITYSIGNYIVIRFITVK